MTEEATRRPVPGYYPERHPSAPPPVSLEAAEPSGDRPADGDAPPSAREGINTSPTPPAQSVGASGFGEVRAQGFDPRLSAPPDTYLTARVPRSSSSIGSVSLSGVAPRSAPQGLEPAATRMGRSQGRGTLTGLGMGAKPRPTHARAADAEGAAGTTPPGAEPLLPVPTPSAVYEQLQAALAMAELHTARPGENRAKIPDLELERSAPAQTPPSGEPAVLDVPYGRVITVTVTAQAPQARRELAVVRSPNSSLAASYRILRQRIKSCGDPRVIAVAGPSWLERSDVCAVNLAMSLAEHAREPVLLLDANVRQPRLARLCEVSPPRCFGEQMVRYVEDEHEPWQVARLVYPGLHLLAVEPSQHYEHFDVLAFRSAMAELQAGPYTHIIVDCPAILDSADVSLIEDCCDAVLLVAATGLTRRSTLERAAALLAPSNLLGVVSVTL